MNVVSSVPDPITTPDQSEMATYDAKDLVKDGVQARIVLDEKTYYLRITRAGKLILTK